MRIITNRPNSKFVMDQLTEQADFRKECSTIEHFHMIRYFIEKSIDYTIQLWIAFIDYKKIFDLLENE